MRNEEPDNFGPWYLRYDEVHEQVLEKKRRFEERCVGLKIAPDVALAEVWRGISARIVHESNWQEGIHLGAGRTKELFDEASSFFDQIAGPHLDIEDLVRVHKRQVIELRKKSATLEEVATFNLSRAHVAVRWVGNELAFRQSASLAKALNDLRPLLAAAQKRIPSVATKEVKRGFDLVDSLKLSPAPVYGPVNTAGGCEGELLKELLQLPMDELMNPFKIEYIHFFHKIALMGMVSASRLGRFRSIHVHLDNPDLVLPPPVAVKPLMDEFSQKFPTILPGTVTYDPVMKAADVSYRFVRIHPYADGNGRVSRLLMNLVLWDHFPPVYIKADKKGRHRYAQALHRADRGNIKPLACLIAMSLNEVYDKLLSALSGGGDAWNPT